LTKDTPGTPLPPPRSNAAVFVLGDYMYVFGGMSSNGAALGDGYVYNLKQFNWTMITPQPKYPNARYGAIAVPLLNRGLLYGGENNGIYFDDINQLVSEVTCFNYGCEDCTTTATGCGWCNVNNEAAYRCIAGDANVPFVPSSCNSTNSMDYITDLDFCPQLFPSYAIALLVIGGVVLVGVVIFAIMKVRSGGEEKSGYERIS